jgi:uncharacterized protein (TIGR02271 family)
VKNPDRPEHREELAIPVIEEELVVDKRTLPIGAVEVRKHILERTETIDMPLLKEEVDIRRVVINQEIDRIPPTREEGDAIIIPVVEEQIVISKRLVLKEELHLTRHRSVRRATEQVVLRREEPEVTRFDSEGRPVPARIRDDGPPSPPPVRRRRILKD